MSGQDPHDAMPRREAEHYTVHTPRGSTAQGEVSPVDISLTNTAHSYELVGVYADTRVMSPNAQRTTITSDPDATMLRLVGY